MDFNVSPAALNEAARKFRKQLLIMAILGIGETLKHMTLRTGIRYEEVVGELSGGVELEPYTGTLNETGGDVEIVGRTLATHLGQAIKLIEPKQLLTSLYGNAITSGKKIETTAINKTIIAMMMRSISNGLNKSIFNAVRNPAGHTTSTLYNGFDKIVADEITATLIAAGKGNYLEIAPITDSNAVDILKSIYHGSSDELQEKKTKLFIPRSVYNSYNEDYKATTGAIPYNTQFKKTFLEGTDDRVELVPLIGKAGSDHIQLTTKANMLVGTYLMGDYEKIEVRRGDNPFKLQFIATMFFGTQFESLSKEVFMNAKITV